jgi:hypothetical protein
MKTRLFILGLALFATTAFVVAQTTPGAKKTNNTARCSGKCKCGRFVDNNNDKTCDKLATRNAPASSDKGKEQPKAVETKKAPKAKSNS